MKRSKLIIFPLVTLLLSGCAMNIKSSEIPELIENPGNLLKMTSTSKASGDKDILAAWHLEKSESETTFEFYTNYLKITAKATEGNDTLKATTHIMYKDKVTYVLTDRNNKKSNEETSDPLKVIFKSNEAQYKMLASAQTFIADSIYYRMGMIDEDQTVDKYTLTRSINTYILKFESIQDEYTVETHSKLTLKNDYYSSFEVTFKYSKDKKSAEQKLSGKVTYAAEERTFSEANMPNPDKFL